MSLSPLLITFVSLLLAVGCGTTRYSVQVNGFLDVNAPTIFAPGAAISVLENQEAKNPLLEREIAVKIRRLLADRGYRAVSDEQAEYYLLFMYGVGPTEMAPAAGPSVAIGIGAGSWRGAGGFIGLGGPYPYYPYPYSLEPIHNRWLTLKVVEGKRYRQSGQAQAVWVGESRSSGASPELREVINALLLATFQQFGKDTRQAITVEVRTEDPKYRELQSLR